MSDPQVAGPLDRATAEHLLRRADELAAAGEYAEVRALASRLVGSPDAEIHVAALLRLADANYRLDDEAAALACWTSAAQAPETRLAWLAWKQLAEARVRAGDIRGAVEAYRAADRRAPAEERAAIASRLGWLTKELGDTRGAGRYFARARGGSDAPLVTYGILALTLIIGLASLGNLHLAQAFFEWFGLDKAAVARGEWWRLVTVVLVHDPTNPLHVLFNMYALWLVGPIVESLYGRWRYLAMYVLTAAAASTLSYLLVREDAVGASGAIFGLFGILFVSIRVHRPLLSRQARALASQIGFLIVVNLAIGFGLMGAGIGIDNFAHIGGLLAGGWLGFAFVPRGATTLAGAFRRPGAPPEAGRGWLEAAAVAVLVATIAAGVVVGTGQRGPSAMTVPTRPAAASSAG